MKKINRLFIMMVLLLSVMTSKAQSDAMSLTLLPNSSYNNFYNPAIPVESKFVLSAVVSNIGLSVYNSSVRYQNLYNFVDGAPVAINANQFINSLDEHDNLINTNFSIDIFRLGFKAGNLFVDFNWRYKYNTELHYSRDFLGFFINGNGNYLGQDNPADFSIGADMSMYSEMALGLQYKINDKLSIGVRPKLLLGTANISVNDDETKIYTDENTYEMTADVNINLKASTILNVDDVYSFSDFTSHFYDMDTIILDEIFDARENIGFGIDFGASYTFNEHFGVAAGVYDLGYIKWRKSKVKHNHKDNVVVNDALIDDFDDLMNMNIDFTDLYTNLVEDVWDNDSIYDGGDYKTTLKTRIMLQGYYELCPMLRVTAISQLYYMNEKIRPAMTLAYSGTFLKVMNLTASYTLSRFSNNCIGVGIGFRLKNINIFAVTDNVMIATKFKASPIEMLTSYKVANARIGFVMTFGNNKK